MSHDPEHLNKHGELSLNEDEQKVLDDWVVYFANKYHTVGKVLPEGAETKDEKAQ